MVNVGNINTPIYQSRYGKKVGTGTSETGEGGIEGKDNPKEKTDGAKVR